MGEFYILNEEKLRSRTMAIYKNDNKPKKNPKIDKIEMLTQYNTWWTLYKKLPIIVPAFVVALFLIWSIFDIALLSTVWNPYYYEEAYHYGVFQLSSWVPVIAIWVGIGIVVAVPFWFFTQTTVSAKTLEIELLCMDLITSIDEEEKSKEVEEKISAITENMGFKK